MCLMCHNAHNLTCTDLTCVFAHLHVEVFLNENLYDAYMSERDLYVFGLIYVCELMGINVE